MFDRLVIKKILPFLETHDILLFYWARQVWKSSLTSSLAFCWRRLSRSPWRTSCLTLRWCLRCQKWSLSLCLTASRRRTSGNSWSRSSSVSSLLSLLRWLRPAAWVRCTKRSLWFRVPSFRFQVFLSLDLGLGTLLELLEQRTPSSLFVWLSRDKSQRS